MERVRISFDDPAVLEDGRDAESLAKHHVWVLGRRPGRVRRWPHGWVNGEVLVVKHDDEGCEECASRRRREARRAVEAAAARLAADEPLRRERLLPSLDGTGVDLVVEVRGEREVAPHTKWDEAPRPLIPLNVPSSSKVVVWREVSRRPATDEEISNSRAAQEFVRAVREWRES